MSEPRSERIREGKSGWESHKLQARAEQHREDNEGMLHRKLHTVSTQGKV